MSTHTYTTPPRNRSPYGPDNQGHTHPNRHHIPHCHRCGLLIFTDPAQATAAQVPYYPHINQAAGRTCTACHKETS